MKLIPLSQKGRNSGKYFTKVDDKDYDYLMQWYWCVYQCRKLIYVGRCCLKGKRKWIGMHRDLMDTTDTEMRVDHINHDGLDNQRSNLRVCTHQENSKNKSKAKWCSSKYLGVSLATAKKTYNTKRGIVTNIKKTYRAKIKTIDKVLMLGSYPCTKEGEILAAKAYDKAAKFYHKEFANLNFKD